MTVVHVQPQGIDSSLSWMEAATPVDAYGLVRTSYDTTNAAGSGWVSRVVTPRARVERAFEFAVRHDFELLRRLAD